MKKNLIAFLLFSMALTLSFTAPKKGKIKGIKLEKKNRFAIDGIGLGSLNWSKVSISNKGEIIWNETNDYQECGWAIMKVDMSQYAGLRFEFVPNPNQDVAVKIRNTVYDGEYGYTVPNDGIVYAFFNGQGRNWGDMKIPDRKDAFSIYTGISKGQNEKTVIKSIELLKKEDVPDASNLELLGVPFGSSSWQTHIIGNEITWIKGETGGDAGWNLSGIDLSEYDRVRVEIESSTAKHLGLRLVDPDHRNWHGFDTPIEPNVYEVDLTGDGASWVGENATDLDKSKGLKIFFQAWDNKPFTKDYKTVVKSVQLLKGKRVINENLMIEGSRFGSSGGNSYIYDGGIVEWVLPQKNWDASAGWNVKGIDLSKWKKIRIELDPESSDLPYLIRMGQGDNSDYCAVHYQPVTPTILEANLDGSDCYYSWSEGATWDASKGINNIQIHIWWQKSEIKNQKTIVKSVSLLTDEDEVKQP